MQSNGASPNALFSVLLAKAARRYDPGNVDLLYIHQPADVIEMTNRIVLGGVNGFFK